MRRKYKLQVNTGGALGFDRALRDHIEEKFGKVRLERNPDLDDSPMRFVMCPPKHHSTAISNNVFMEGKPKPINIKESMDQYNRIKRCILSYDIPLLEIPPEPGCQDQVFVANIGVAIAPYIVLANFKAAGRPCEEEPARRFFESQGFQVIQPPNDFEGEADFKKWKDNIYFGSYGKFTDREALDWISRRTGCEVIPIQITSDKLYHLDCDLHVLDEKTIVVNPAGISKESYKTLKSLGVTIIDVPPDIADTGITNCVRVPNKPILLSGIRTAPELPIYRKSMEWLDEHVGDKYDLTVLFFSIPEADKSGADISCMVMHVDF